MKSIKDLLKGNPLFLELDDEHLEDLAGCSKNMYRKEGEYLFKERSPANEFYLLRNGKVALELNGPGNKHLTLETFVSGDIIGWSWIYPPYTWNYDCICLEDCRLTTLDGKCLRKKCQMDHKLGHLFMKAFGQIMVSRLKSTRLQLLDLYGETRE